MKKVITCMMIIASSITLAGTNNSNLIKKIDRASDVSSYDQSANGTFFELKENICLKITTKGANRGQGTGARVKSKQEVDLSNCRSHLIANKISNKLKAKELSCYNSGVWGGDRTVVIENSRSGEQGALEAESVYKVTNLLASDCSCVQRIDDYKFVSTTRSILTSPLSTLFNGIATSGYATETLLDVNSCLNIIEDDAPTAISQAISEAYNEVEYELTIKD